MKSLLNYFLKCSSVSTDTRTVEPNSLFFCLKGENFDGNTFAQTALEKGAKYAVIDSETAFIEGKTILVKDTLVALQELANTYRKRFSIPVLGITGSNGKTTSKELIAAVLSTQLNVHYTKGNLNNHIGVPLTLLGLKMEHQIAIIEMGANKPGDIQELVEIAEPTHGIITNIGRAHLEGFGSLEGVIKTKTEMYRFLAGTNETIFVNAKDETLTSNIPTNCKVELYNNESLKGELISLNPFVEMKWSEKIGDISSESSILKTQLIGEYNFLNFLAAIKIGRYFGISVENCSKAIENYTPTNNRSQVSKTENNTLIIDCYNANPSSMQSALQSFAKIDNHQKIFVLGDMREMGNDAEMVHKEIVDLTIELRLSGFFVGEEFLKLKGSHPQALFLKSTEPLMEHFTQVPPKELLILLKGSRGIALEKLIPLL